MIDQLQNKSARILFLGPNDQSTDDVITSIATKNNNVNHGLLVDPNFVPDKSGYYHTTINDIPIGLLIKLAENFDVIVLLDQPQSQWSHWKNLSATFKIMLRLEELGKTTVFRDNANVKNMLHWVDVLYNKNKSFCIYPWINYYARGNNLATCSRSIKSITTTNKFTDWETDPDYVNIREKMINGEKLPDYCSRCYKNEDLGIESYRQFDSLDWLTLLEIESFDDLKKIKHPYFYEVQIGNHCNIKCRGCHPAFSEPIGKELKKFNIVTSANIRWDVSSMDIDRINIDTLSKNSSVYFQGGEPTIMPEVLEFMRKCIEKNKTDFFFTLCTNGVKLSDEFLNLVLNFSNTNFSVSIDGFGHINDYWRSGSNWEKVIGNIRLLQSQGHSISINTVPGIYNVTNLHLLLEFLDREFPFTSIYMQINGNKWQSAFNHPNTELVINSMKKCMNTSIYNSNGKSCKTAIDSIYEHYIKNPSCNIDDLRVFFDYNDQLDRARGVKLVDYIPELEAARSLL